VTDSRIDGGLLGVFPSFDIPGGVQYSGRLAWEGIEDGLGPKHSGAIETYLFSYGGKHAGQSSNGDRAIVASSKPAALLSAVRTRWRVKTILVWHLALLKLLPFFRHPDAEIALFLHGIEAWKRQDLLTRTLLKRVSLFLTNSDNTWTQFVTHNSLFRNVNYVKVPLGILSPTITRVGPDSVPAALMIGRLHPDENYKGHKEMIDIWPVVLKQKADAELWIVGDGELKPKLEQRVASLGLSQRVRFYGWVSEQRKQELIDNCRFLALPSRGEGFGLVYLEAMRQGRPCLVSDSDAGREVVNPPEAGLAVNPSRPDAMAEAVCRLLNDSSEWENWSRQARLRYESHYTAKHFQDRLVAAISTLNCS